MAVSDRLHHLQFTDLIEREYWHIFHQDFGPLVPHPASLARLALVHDRPPGTVVRAAFFLAWTAAGAIWETGLRGIPGDETEVELDPGWLATHYLARLRLMRRLPIIALDHPLRRMIIDIDSPEDQRWHGHLTTHRYRRTHFAAAAVDAQCREAGQILPGFQWYSRQLQGDRVGVLYPPVFDPADWEVTEVIRLDTPEGRALIARALAAGGYTVARSLGWVGGRPEMER